jgi:hypothetical protein
LLQSGLSEVAAKGEPDDREALRGSLCLGR